MTPEERKRRNLEAVRRYQERHPDRVASARAKYPREKMREAGRKHDLANRKERYGAARRYGLSQTQVEEIVRKQGGCCKICNEPLKGGRSQHIDHVHQTDVRTGLFKKGCTPEFVRDVLCAGCNTGLGKFDDNPELLERAAEYVRKNGAI